jgi:carbamoyl-phosphate synthase large subunit
LENGNVVETGIIDDLNIEPQKTQKISFEPTIDYVVTKVPRFTFEKFQNTEPLLGTSMKSVGEAMAIGRNFKESFQKAIISLEVGYGGLDKIKNINKKTILNKLKKNIPDKLLMVADAFRKKISTQQIYSRSRIDKWFLEQIKGIVDLEKQIIKRGLPKSFNKLNYIKIGQNAINNIQKTVVSDQGTGVDFVFSNSGCHHKLYCDT